MALKRIDRKLWKYEENAPVRVEIAVLQYLEAKGWGGYFTEWWDYEAVCIAVMGWPNRKKLLPPKLQTLHCLFYLGADGWLKDNGVHNYKFEEVLSSVLSFDSMQFRSELTRFTNQKTKNFIVGRSNVKGRSFADLDIDHVCSYFLAAGKTALVQCVQDTFSYEQLLRRKKIFDLEQIIFGLEQQGKIEGKQRFIPEIISFYAYQGLEKYNYIVPAWKEIAMFQSDSEVRNTILEACCFAESARAKTLEFQKFTSLDLQLWDDKGLAYVEVKAPNDWLMKNQIATIDALQSQGKRVWVIEVDEA